MKSGVIVRLRRDYNHPRSGYHNSTLHSQLSTLINPPPSRRSPSYSTALCPGAGARTGLSQRMRAEPSESARTSQGGSSHFVWRTRTLAAMGAASGASMSQLKSESRISVLKSSYHSASSIVLVLASMRET